MINPFQKEWQDLARRWSLDVETPCVVEIGDHKITVPVRLRNFGAPRGMLLVTDFELLSRIADELVAMGFGFSCLSEPTGLGHPKDDEAFMEMLSDWGWAGEGYPPAWYHETTS